MFDLVVTEIPQVYYRNFRQNQLTKLYFTALLSLTRAFANYGSIVGW